MLLVFFILLTACENDGIDEKNNPNGKAFIISEEDYSRALEEYGEIVASADDAKSAEDMIIGLKNMIKTYESEQDQLFIYLENQKEILSEINNDEERKMLYEELIIETQSQIEGLSEIMEKYSQMIVDLESGKLLEEEAPLDVDEELPDIDTSESE